MPEITDVKPGRFCWFELGTTNAGQAKEFYQGLFGWTISDQAMPGMVYSMLKLDGKDVGGLYEMDASMRAAGIPPHWLVYIATASADESAEKARAAGGSIMNGPFDVHDQGRMAVVKDPQGAVFGVWQAKAHKGVRLFGETNGPCWAELATTDDEGARRFYTALAGWQADVKSDGPIPYTEWINDGQVEGGMLRMDGDQWKGVPPHWQTYFAVADCDASAARAASLGAKVLVPPSDIPGVGRFSVIADPAGAAFSIIKMAQHP